MNEAERAELDKLRQRQNVLQDQLTELNYALEAFEQRLASAAQANIAPQTPEAVPAAPPLPEPMEIPNLEPVIQVVPPPPAPVPPIIGTFQSHPVPKSTPVPQKEVTEMKSDAQSLKAFGALQTAPPQLPRPKPATPPVAETRPKSSFEMRLGTFWLVRIGIVMLLTALAFFGNYAYQNFIPKLGAGGKVGLLYLASAALIGLGSWFQRKQEKLKNYAQVLLAGGLAAVYFTTYAAHHIPALEVIRSTLLDGALLLGWAGFVIWLADRKKSEVLALFAILLAYYTSIITHVGLFTLYSNLVLTAAAVFFLVRNRWATLSFASLAATYISYGFWRFYQNGHWQWASPGEGLWTGNCFLVGYWIMFTVAVFLSKHEQFAGPKRASFVSTNNMAFFSAFLLTMFQVHQGGFWKFALLYGTILLAMAVLAQSLFAPDKLLRNTYLTQGLLLVTLGFVTKFTGWQLSLVLAVESVALTILGRELKNKVLQIGSYVTALLAVAWGISTLRLLDQNGLIIGSVVGALMLFNALTFRKKTTFETSDTHAPTVFFTLLALLTWVATTWQNTNADSRGLVFACESLGLLFVARPLGNRWLSFSAPAFATIGVSWEINAFVEQFRTVDLANRTGLTQGIYIGALMLANALGHRRVQPPTERKAFGAITGIFSGLALAMWLTATFVFTPREYLAPALAIEALLFTFSYYVLRLGELTLFGQFFLLLAQLFWISESLATHPNHPWWNPALVIGLTMVVSQWWQRQTVLNIKRDSTLALQGVYALAAVALLYFWLQPHFAGQDWLAFTSLLAIVISVYGFLTRSWFMVAAGQFFLVVSGCQFATQLANGEPGWFLALAPMAALGFLSIFTVSWLAGKPGISRMITEPVLQIALVYRVAAVAMSLWWTWRYIHPAEQCWFLAVAGFVLFLLAGWRRNQELLIYSAIFTFAGVVRFLIPAGETVYWPDFLALLLIPIQQRIAKSFQKNYPLSAEIHAGAMIVGGLSLWLYLSRWVLISADGFYLTATWSGWALVLFIVGIALRERVYRWLGLGVLGCALGRVAIFDVWKLATIYQILSFMALGIVLLVLGFLYNKYQEKIKEWL